MKTERDWKGKERRKGSGITSRIYINRGPLHTKGEEGEYHRNGFKGDSRMTFGEKEEGTGEEESGEKTKTERGTERDWKGKEEGKRDNIPHIYKQRPSILKGEKGEEGVEGERE